MCSCANCRLASFDEMSVALLFVYLMLQVQLDEDVSLPTSSDNGHGQSYT